MRKRHNILQHHDIKQRETRNINRYNSDLQKNHPRQTIQKMQAEGKDNDFMQKLDLEKDRSRLKYSDLIYIKRAEEVAVQRALRYRRTRKNCIVLGISLACFAVGIYAYTINAMKQETFLDDLKEPEKVIEKSTSNNNGP